MNQPTFISQTILDLSKIFNMHFTMIKSFQNEMKKICKFPLRTLTFLQILNLLILYLENFVPEDNRKINNKNDNLNKLIIVKKSK